VKGLVELGLQLGTDSSVKPDFVLRLEWRCVTMDPLEEREMSTELPHTAGPEKQPESPCSCSWCN
jgi:hypothetical protein